MNDFLRLTLIFCTMLYDEKEIEEIYQRNLDAAGRLLSTLQVADGRMPKVGGLSGWIYEQTIRYCLEKELLYRGLRIPIEEQVPISGRAKVDLLLDGKVAIEIKSLGSFGSDIEKFRKYIPLVLKKGWIYLYLTRRERHEPYRKAFEEMFSRRHAFFLDTEGEWARFVGTVLEYIGTDLQFENRT